MKALTKERDCIYNAGRKSERQECWEAINKLIILGKLPNEGNGTDPSAQRNGLVLASNAIADRMDKC